MPALDTVARVIARSGFLPLFVTLAIVLLASGCGGGGPRSKDGTTVEDEGATTVTESSARPAATLPGDVLAMVGGIPITTLALTHWISRVAGADYVAHVGGIAPAGLVSYPANYPVCIRAASGIVPHSSTGRPAMTSRQLRSRCHELYNAFERETLDLLIDHAWTMRQADEQGVAVTGEEVRRAELSRFKTPAGFRRFLSDQGWTEYDEVTELRSELTDGKLLGKFRERHTGSNWEREYGELLEASIKKWTAATVCRVGYVTQRCSEYQASRSSPEESPADLLEDLAAGR
jgi:hypothetical protein